MAIYNEDEDPNIYPINDNREEDEDQITEALDFLESKGFFIKNLWHVQDVQTKFDCTEEEAFDILDDAVNGEWIIELINDRISEYGDVKNLNRQ